MGRKLPYYFSKHELMQVVDKIDDPKVMVAFTLALFCGLRLSEVCKLKFQDLDLLESKLIVRDGKTKYKKINGYGKDRIVPIPIRIISILKMWKGMNQEQEYLFPSIKDGVKHMHGYYLTNNFSLILEKAQLRIPESKNSLGKVRHKYTFHTLRHTYATMLWEKTGDIYAVKSALGHSDLDTTMIYTHVSNKALKEKISNAFDFGFVKNKIEIDTSSLEPNKIETKSPIEYLQMRLVKGEIDLNQFNQIVSVL